MSMLWDTVLALGISAGLVVQADRANVRAMQVTKATQTGQYMQGLQQAVNKYIAVNGDVLSGRSTDSLTNPQGAPITVVHPLQPTLTELQANDFLPTGYTLTNPAKVTFTVDISPTLDCPGPGCQMPATITSTPYRDSQGHVRNDLMAYAVAAAGLDGAQSLVSSPGQFTSLGNTWAMPNPTHQAGCLMMRAGVLTTGYVDTLPFYKLDGSRPLTGTMQANGQNIIDAGNVQSASLTTGSLTAQDGDFKGKVKVKKALIAGNVVYLPALAQAGWGCNGNGITTDPNGQLLACQSGVWNSMGGHSGLSRVGQNGLSFNADADYPSLIVTVSSKFAPTDVTHTANATYNVFVDGAWIGQITNSINVYKGGDRGHYWAYESVATSQKQFFIPIRRGSNISVLLAAQYLHLASDIRTDLVN